MVKVSVVIPVYNAEKYLRQCLDSVLGQSLREIEVICVDDGSTDGSIEILREYSERDRRIRIISQENSGPGIARNTGLAAAIGDYVVFLDSDDWFELDFLEDMHECIERNSADVCICKAERFDSGSGSTLDSEWMLKTELLPGECFSPEEISEHLFQFTYGQVWDKLYLRKFLLDKSLLFPDMRAAEDTAFVYKGLLLAKRICVLPEVKVHYRVNVNGSVSNSFVKYPEAPFKAFEQVYEFIKERGLYVYYERSFLNWAMEYLVWQVCNMPDERIRKEYFYEFRKKWVREMCFKAHHVNYYYKKQNFIKYVFLNKFPLSVLEIALIINKLIKRG